MIEAVVDPLAVQVHLETAWLAGYLARECSSGCGSNAEMTRQASEYGARKIDEVPARALSSVLAEHDMLVASLRRQLHDARRLELLAVCQRVLAERELEQLKAAQS